MSRKTNTVRQIGNVLVLDVSTPKYPSRFAKIDAADRELVLDGGGRWFAMTCGGETLYVRRRHGNGVQMLHRLILEAPKGVLVDHKNGDGLDNRRKNIRLVTAGDNMRNRRLNANNRSGVSGVCWDKGTRKWQAQIKVEGHMIYLGQFGELDDAIATRLAAEKEHGFHKNHGRQGRNAA
ncbi:HNH endonuclease [Epibacterium ulvae]|uniref:HNH endonuclease n=1 Tax=Epibacterium ulvae TaxID=1156985 RepID=UPI001BFC245D|nr:HNH endonuclease [Epibacterium ulvae]MBT8152725.1 HNH endonuclease [Epibacterium ulvae]